jgi:hypothetical protein
MNDKKHHTMVELRTETAALAQADIDIAAGKARVAQQKALVETLEATERDTEMAVTLLGTLQNALVAMEGHRAFIVARIEQLRHLGGSGEPTR